MKIQFEEAVSAFKNRFPAENDGWAEVHRVLEQAEVIVCRCGAKHSIHIERRTARCLECRRKFAFTPGTFFESKKRILVWLLGIYLLQYKVGFSAVQLAKAAAVSYSTAWRVLKKIRAVLREQLPASAQLIPIFHLEEIVNRRSRSTPAGEHPAVECYSGLHQGRATRTGVSSDYFAPISGESKSGGDSITDLTALQREILEMIGDVPVTFDSICRDLNIDFATLASSVTMLEITKGLVVVKGGRVWRTVPVVTDVKDAVSKVNPLAVQRTRQIRSAHGGVGINYLEDYIAAEWFRALSEEECVTSLMDFCIAWSPTQAITAVDPKASGLLRLA